MVNRRKCVPPVKPSASMAYAVWEGDRRKTTQLFHNSDKAGSLVIAGLYALPTRKTAG